MNEVYITKCSKFLPNDAVSNDEIETFLGLINNRFSKTKALILKNNGIKNRYYAIDKDGRPTHTNADLTAAAVQGLFDENFSPNDLEMLACGTSTPDQLFPSHASMVHGLLKNRSMELSSSSGVCCSGMNAMKAAFLNVKAGLTKNAACTGSERVSTWLSAGNFEPEVSRLEELNEKPILGFEKDFLRWMLSDGAGAVLLENAPNAPISLKIEWMEFYSYAHEIEACMYAGADKNDDGSLKPWSEFTPEEWLQQSIFGIKQDVKLLDEHIMQKGSDSLKSSLDKHQLTGNDINYFLAHMSSYYFVDKLQNSLANNNIEIPSEKWFLNLDKVGNVGSASIYLMLEELMNSGKLKNDDTILLAVPESSRFSYAHAFLRVCINQ